MNRLPTLFAFVVTACATQTAPLPSSTKKQRKMHTKKSGRGKNVGERPACRGFGKSSGQVEYPLYSIQVHTMRSRSISSTVASFPRPLTGDHVIISPHTCGRSGMLEVCVQRKKGLAWADSRFGALLTRAAPGGGVSRPADRTRNFGCRGWFFRPSVPSVPCALFVLCFPSARPSFSAMACGVPVFWEVCGRGQNLISSQNGDGKVHVLLLGAIHQVFACILEMWK